MRNSNNQSESVKQYSRLHACCIPCDVQLCSAVPQMIEMDESDDDDFISHNAKKIGEKPLLASSSTEDSHFVAGCDIPKADQRRLEEIFPFGYNSKIVSYKAEAKGFTCELRLNIQDKKGALQWLKDFTEKSLTTYRVERTYEEMTNVIVFKKEYHCLHNTKPNSHKTIKPHAKHVNCGAKLKIIVKQKNMRRSKDVDLKTRPCRIVLRHLHNHPLVAADTLRHRVPTEAVERIFKDLFTKGHSPSSALDLYKFELQNKYGDKYYQVAADGSICPKRKWCYDLYYSIFKKEYGDPTGPEMVETLKTFVQDYNSKNKSDCAAIAIDNDDLIVAICTPLMKRIHEHIKSSSEIMFVDASGNMDRHDTRVFLLLCPSIAGGLPLGIIMVFSECEDVITKGLRLLQSIVPECAFFGTEGPKIIITDDSTSERKSLATCFPNSTLLLCKFHVLQAVMRYLWDSKHGVSADDRTYIYNMFSKVLNAKSEDSHLEAFAALFDDTVVMKYDIAVEYFKRLQTRAVEWALCFRTRHLTRGNDTNNTVEAAFKVLKDKILKRLKAFSVVQMFDFLTTNLESYYERKIADLLNNRLEGYTKSKYFIPLSKLEGLTSHNVAGELYSVTNSASGKTYIVNTLVEMCTCPVGSQGAPCKHQFAVVTKYRLHSNQFVTAVDSQTKEIFHQVLTGCANTLPGWYDNLAGREMRDTSSTVTSPNVVSVTEDLLLNGSHDASSSVLETPSISEASLQKTAGDLQSCCDLLKSKLHERPEIYSAAIDKFVDLFQNCHTDSSMVSALHTFGKYSGAAVPLIKSGKNLQGGKIIGVQPAAVRRRTVYTGGRHAQQSGRPAKRDFLPDHSYQKNKRSSDPKWELPPAKKQAAPHSLNHCVQNNTALGKSHSKK